VHGLVEPVEPPHVPSYDISDLDDPVLAMSIINGADKGIFGVDNMVTREEMVSMLNKARAASKTSAGRDLTEDEWSDKIRFATRGLFADAVADAFGLYDAHLENLKNGDAHGVEIDPSHRFAKAVTALNALGLLDLYRSDRQFRPARPVTRGEAVEILMKAMTVRRHEFNRR
jgi:hypothetical protein